MIKINNHEKKAKYTLDFGQKTGHNSSKKVSSIYGMIKINNHDKRPNIRSILAKKRVTILVKKWRDGSIGQ